MELPDCCTNARMDIGQFPPDLEIQQNDLSRSFVTGRQPGDLAMNTSNDVKCREIRGFASLRFRRFAFIVIIGLTIPKMAGSDQLRRLPTSVNWKRTQLRLALMRTSNEMVCSLSNPTDEYGVKDGSRNLEGKSRRVLHVNDDRLFPSSWP